MTTRRSTASDVHPRPQLARERWLELDGSWEFAHDDGDRGWESSWATGRIALPGRITVPFPPESELSGVAVRDIHPIMWYRRVVNLRRTPGRRWLLHFGAIDYQAAVFVNGNLVVEHVGGHTPFSADITGSLVDTGEQVIVVRAEDWPSLEQPRGKQFWSEHPEGIFYDRTSGIWQPVWLEEVATTHIASLRWTPSVPDMRLGMEVMVRGPLHDGLRLRVTLAARGRTLVDDTYAVTGPALRRWIGVDIGPRREYLWSPEYPNLIAAHLTLLDGDTAVDEVDSYVGLRSVVTRDGAFQLNGSRYYLRLVLDQGYWPESHLAAPSADALRRDVELVKELGFNGVRIHQKIEDPRFLYWCDRLGLLVWEEMPSFYLHTPEAVEASAREWLEALRRDYSHPCVVAWVPCNESWGVEWLRERRAQRAVPRALRALADAVDGTRPVVANDGWEFDTGDIIGIHDYATDPTVLRARYGNAAALEDWLRAAQPNGRPILLPDTVRHDEPVVLSEFGGVTLKPASGDEWYGYDVVADAEALAARWEDLFSAVLDSDALAGCCYTQFADTRQETNGMVTDRRVPKVDPARVRAMVHHVRGPLDEHEKSPR